MERVDFSFTLVVAGDSSVGKTSLIRRMSKQDFVKSNESTVSGLLYPVTMKVDDINVRLNIWDISGVTDYMEMNAAHFADAQGCLFLYSGDNEESLYHLVDVWKEELDKESFVPHENFMAGTKSDLPTIIDEKSIADVASQLKVTNFFVSAVDGSGIQDLLNYMTKQLIENQAPKRRLTRITQKDKFENVSMENKYSDFESSDAETDSKKKKTKKHRKHKSNSTEEHFCGCNVA